MIVYHCSYCDTRLKLYGTGYMCPNCKQFQVREPIRRSRMRDMNPYISTRELLKFAQMENMVEQE